MNGSNLKERIGQKRPRYNNRYRKLIEIISNKGDATGAGNFSSFGAFYQTFMYAFIIGYKLKKCVPIEKGEGTTDFASFSDWKPIGIRDYILMLLLNESQMFNFSWIELENSNEETINNFITELFRRMESYANGGFEYLQDKFDNEKIEFQDPFVFVNFIEEIEMKQEVIELI
jgi:hypothetical protein